MSLLNNIIIKTIPLLPKNMVKIIADQYVAGNTTDDAIYKTKQLNLFSILMNSGQSKYDSFKLLFFCVSKKKF